MRTVEASRRLGTHVMMSGLSCEIALPLATKGVDLSEVNAMGDLKASLSKPSGYSAA